MKLSFFATFVSSALLIAVAEAAGHGDTAFAAAPAHAHVVRRAHGSNAHLNRLSKRKANGRCKPRQTTSVAPTSSSTPAPAAATSTTKHDEKPSSSSPAAQATPVTNNAAAAAPAGQSSSGGHGQQGSGASSKITADSGPNGDEDWFNTGLYSTGWQPPYLAISDLKVVDLAEAVKDPNSPFRYCMSFIDEFYKAGSAHNIPPIMLASIAMQESSCNPHTVGGNGEQGLMQLTHDKCFDAPGGNCQDIGFNINRGAEFLSDTLKEVKGSVLLAIGRYNGWRQGMTIGEATAAGNNPATCRAQNNVDYHQQFLNGWCQNYNAYDGPIRLGKIFNLDKCNH